MIRINLLPIKQIKKRARLRKEFFGFVAAFLLVLFALGVIFQWQASSIAGLQTTIAHLNKKKASYDKLIKEIADLQKTKEMLDAKVEAIKQLKTNSSVAVHLIDEVALRTPQNRMWLTALSQNANSISLQGVALDNATIAQYMQSMDSSAYFRNAELISSSLVDIAGQKLKSFRMTVSIVVPEIKSEQTPADAG